MLILFPQTNRVAVRQKLLLEELARKADVLIADISHNKGDMSDVSGAYAVEFSKYLKDRKPDLVLIRADRFENLPFAMVSAYQGIPIVHIESFDESGVIDNKVRGAISWLSDYHFATNEESYRRGLSMGFKNVWNYGSLDCEYALSVPHSVLHSKPYILVLWHEIPNEDSNELYGAIQAFQDYEIVGVKGNKDYGIESSYKEEYSPEDFINLLRGASCLVGNSSAGIKEASVLGTPVVNIGNRQQNRLTPHNILNVACMKKNIELGIRFQLGHGKYEKSDVYSQTNTSKRIAERILNLDIMVG